MPRFLACNYEEERLREIAARVERLSISLPHYVNRSYLDFNNEVSGAPYQRPWMKALSLCVNDKTSTGIDELLLVSESPNIINCANEYEASSFAIKASQPIVLPQEFISFDENTAALQDMVEDWTLRHEVSMTQFEEVLITDPLLSFARNFPSIHQLHRCLKFKTADDPFDNSDGLLSDFGKVKGSSLNLGEWLISDYEINSKTLCENMKQSISAEALNISFSANLNFDELRYKNNESMFSKELSLETLSEPTAVQYPSKLGCEKGTFVNLTSFDIDTFDINTDLNNTNSPVKSELEPGGFSIVNNVNGPDFEIVSFKDHLHSTVFSNGIKIIDSPIVIMREIKHMSLQHPSHNLSSFVIPSTSNVLNFGRSIQEQLVACFNESELSVQGIINNLKVLDTVDTSKELMYLPSYALCAMNSCKIEISHEDDSTSLPWDVVERDSSRSGCNIHNKLLKRMIIDWRIPNLRKRSRDRSKDKELLIKTCKFEDFLEFPAACSEFDCIKSNLKNRHKSRVLPLMNKSSPPRNISCIDNLSNKTFCELNIFNCKDTLCEMASRKSSVNNHSNCDQSALLYSKKAADASKIDLGNEAYKPVAIFVSPCALGENVPLKSPLHNNDCEEITINKDISMLFFSGSEVVAPNKIPSLRNNDVPNIHDSTVTSAEEFNSSMLPINKTFADVQDMPEITKHIPLIISERIVKQSTMFSSSLADSVVQPDVLHPISGLVGTSENIVTEPGAPSYLALVNGTVSKTNEISETFNFRLPTSCMTSSLVKVTMSDKDKTSSSLRLPTSSMTSSLVKGTMLDKDKTPASTSLCLPTSSTNRDDITDDIANRSTDPCERFFSLLQVSPPVGQSDSIPLSASSCSVVQTSLQSSGLKLSNTVTCMSGVNNYNVNNHGLMNKISSKISNRVIANILDSATSATFNLITSGVSDEKIVDTSYDMMADFSGDIASCISGEMEEDISKNVSASVFHKGSNSINQILDSSCTENKSLAQVKSLAVHFPILEVTLNEPYHQLLCDIRCLAEPYLKLLRQHQMIGRRSSFESLSSDFTGFTLKQGYHDWQRNGGSLEVMQAALYIDTMVRIVECIASSSVSCALVWLETRRQMSKRLSDEGLDAIQRLLISAESRHKLVVHPKISHVSFLIRQHLNEAPEDSDIKVLIIVKRNCEALAENIKNVIDNIPGIRTCVDQKDSDNLLNKSNCHILEECHIITSPWLPNATLLIEYEYVYESQWPSFCIEHGKRFAGIKTGLIDWSVLLSDSNTVQRESSDILTKCSTQAEERNEEKQLVVIASVSVTRMRGLLEVLESAQNIQVIDRDYISIQERAYRDTGNRCLQFEDIAVDHQTCIVLHDTSTLNGKDALEVLIIKVADLQCKFQSCWVLLYSVPNTFAHNINHRDIEEYTCSMDYISKLEGTLNLLASKLEDYNVKVVHCRTYHALAEIVHNIALHSGIDAQCIDVQMNCDSIMSDPNEDEIWLLINFSCLNSFSAQILLKYFGSREALMSSSEKDLRQCCPQISERILSTFLKIKARHLLVTAESCNRKEKSSNAPINNINYLGELEIKSKKVIAQKEIIKAHAVLDSNESHCDKHRVSKVSEELSHHKSLNTCRSKKNNERSYDEESSNRLERNEILEGEYLSPFLNVGDSYVSSNVKMNQINISNVNAGTPYTYIKNDANTSGASENVSISWSPNTHNASDITDSQATDIEVTNSPVNAELNRDTDSPPNNEFVRSIIEVGRDQYLFNTDSDLLNSAEYKRISESSLDESQNNICKESANSSCISDEIDKKRLNTARWEVMWDVNDIHDDLSQLEDTQTQLNAENHSSNYRQSSADINIASHRPGSHSSAATHTASYIETSKQLCKDFHSLYSTTKPTSAQALLTPRQLNQNLCVDGSQHQSSKRVIACITPSVRVPIRPLSLQTGSSIVSQSSMAIASFGVKPQQVMGVMATHPRMPNSVNFELVCRTDFDEHFSTSGVTCTPMRIKSNKARKRPPTTIPQWGVARNSDSDLHNITTNSSRKTYTGKGGVKPSGGSIDYCQTWGDHHIVSGNEGEAANVPLFNGMMKAPCKRSRLTFQRDSRLKGGQTRLTFI